jgi:glucan phosphoethanolaminetransferase (alkaline phosphatase superfamily)
VQFLLDVSLVSGVTLAAPMEVHVLWGLLIPVLFLILTGLVKSLVRKDLLWSTFFLGVDATLAALANGIVNIVDEVHETETSKEAAASLGNHMFYTACFLAVAIAVLLTVMTVHQRYENDLGNSRFWRGFLLGGMSNLLGAGLLGAYIYMKLRGLI